MTTAPDSVKACQLFDALLSAHAQSYNRGFNPGLFLQTLHAKGWAVTAIEPIVAEPAADQADNGL